MEILELHLKHFGKFQDHKVRLYPGINIIYGGNESGKTTLHAFIRAMFFGFERRGRGGKNEEYLLRRPWDNPAYFAGTMRLKYRGELYRVERNFDKNDREVRLICESAGRELPAGAKELSELLGGLNETAFCNTVFIPQTGCETDSGLAQELKRFMVNFQESGDSSLDVTKALDSLKARRREVENTRKREQDQIDEEINRKRMEEDFVRKELKKADQESPGDGFPSFESGMGEDKAFQEGTGEKDAGVSENAPSALSKDAFANPDRKKESRTSAKPEEERAAPGQIDISWFAQPQNKEELERQRDRNLSRRDTKDGQRSGQGKDLFLVCKRQIETVERLFTDHK